MKRLAIIASHPIQYYAPWFRYLAAQTDLDIKVFYLWNPDLQRSYDREFQATVAWDLPLLEGYEHEFIPNHSKDPGTHHFNGLYTPDLSAKLVAWRPTAALFTVYRYRTPLSLLLSSHKLKIPLLLRGDSHNIGRSPKSVRQVLRRIALSFILRKFTACLYVGSANMRCLQSVGIPQSKLFFSPHAVDNNRFAAAASQCDRVAWRHAMGIPAQNVVVLFVGKFIEKKRPLDLLQAHQQANAKNTTLVLLGSGPLEAELRRQAAGSGNIVFVPFQNQSVMPYAYSASDIVALPSFGPYETWGLCINEAMASGKAVIASSHVGCASDIIHPDRNGLIFPAGDVAALADCLSRSCSNSSKLIDWGQESLRIIRDYSYEKAAQGLLQALDGIG